MKLLLNVLPVLMLIAGLSLTTPGTGNVTIEGSVLDATTGKPVKDVYVYTVSGEEENLTDAKGRFKFKTWKALPVSCTATHKDFKQEVIQVKDTNPITIKLSRK